MPGFSHFLGNRTINFRMFECLVTCFLRATVSLLCRLQAYQRYMFVIYPCLIISEGRRNSAIFWSHSNETATVRVCHCQYVEPRLSICQTIDNMSNMSNRDCQYVAKYKNTCENWCWYISENLRIVALKLLELTEFASPNLSIYFNFLWCWGSVVMLTFLN